MFVVGVDDWVCVVGVYFVVGGEFGYFIVVVVDEEDVVVEVIGDGLFVV